MTAAGIGELFPVHVDGLVAGDPAVLVEVANRLAARPGRCVVVANDAAGVTAGRGGGFALVIGLVIGEDRAGEPRRTAWLRRRHGSGRPA